MSRDFIEHLERASRVVATWPAWKRDVLGSTMEQTRPIEPSVCIACDETPRVFDVGDLFWVECECGVSGPTCASRDGAVLSWDRLIHQGTVNTAIAAALVQCQAEVECARDEISRLREEHADERSKLMTEIVRWKGACEGGEPPARYDMSSRRMTRCQADCDGDCEWVGCPQLRDGEPGRSGRHCPWDVVVDDEDDEDDDE